MRRQTIFAALAVMFILITAVYATAAEVRSITSSELVLMMSGKEPIVIVDVREPELYMMGHIKGAINIPYDTAHKRILKELSPMDTIVFVCHGGPMGDELGAILAKNGYPRVFNLRGGMNKWTGPLATGRQAP
ncbi:MAG: rhodanese-like domain-containing protein [Deltaproteobacteria bacterium]